MGARALFVCRNKRCNNNSNCNSHPRRRRENLSTTGTSSCRVVLLLSHDDDWSGPRISLGHFLLPLLAPRRHSLTVAAAVLPVKQGCCCCCCSSLAKIDDEPASSCSSSLLSQSFTALAQCKEERETRHRKLRGWAELSLSGANNDVFCPLPNDDDDDAAVTDRPATLLFGLSRTSSSSSN